MGPTMESLVYGLVTASTTMAGGMWIASRPRKWLTSSRLAAMMSLGAGLLMAVLCFELLPESVAHGGPHAFLYLFGGMLAVILFERYLAPRLNFFGPEGAACHAHEHEHAHDHAHEHAEEAVAHAPDHALAHAHDHGPLISHGAACSALGCLLVCTFFDGVAMMAGFSVSVPVGMLIALGLIFHMLPEGVLAATVVLAAGSTAKRARMAAAATAVAFLAGMAVPFLLGSAVGSMAFALPVAAGVLLYIVLGQLLPVAMRTANGVPLVVAGALIFGLVVQLIPHTH